MRDRDAMRCRFFQAPASLVLVLALMIALIIATKSQAGEAFVATTSFEISGSTSRVDLSAPYSTTLDEYTIHSDAVLRRHGSMIYVLNRLFSDNVLVLDASNGYGVVSQWSTTAVGANPRDLVHTGASRAYLSLYESNLLWVGDPSTGLGAGTVDLTPFASDSDGLVEADQMARLAGRLFVAMQSLDRNAGWVPSGHSAVAVIDGASGALVDADPVTPSLDAIALQYQNPFWQMAYEPLLQRLVVLCSGRFLVEDGALELINPFTLQSEGALITESVLGGDLLAYALVSAQLGYALIEKSNFDTCVVRFDPSTATKIDEVYCSNGFQLQDLELSTTNMLVIGDRTASAPGLRFFDAVSGSPLAGPIDVGLPPFDIVLVEDLPTAAPSAAAASPLRLWPNPSQVGGAMHIESAADLRALALYDARGRLVRRLTRRGSDWSFDGRDEQGLPLSAGTYYLRELGGHGRTTRLTLTTR